MKYLTGLLAVLALAGAPAAAESKTTAKRKPSPGTVYRVHRDLDRVQVMDHQERIFVVSAKCPQLRGRNRNVSGQKLRTGDQVWFTTVTGS